MILNIIWTSFFLLAAVSALFQTIVLQQTDVLVNIMDSLFSMAKTAFDISIGLTGVMALWLGLMRIGEAAGAMTFVSRLLAPLLQRLFPGIPKGHPAFGAIIMN